MGFGVDICLIEATRNTSCQDRRGDPFYHQIRKHILHHRLLRKHLLKSLPMCRVMDCLQYRLAHYSCGGKRGIKARMVHHVHDRTNPLPLIADQFRPGVSCTQFQRTHSSDRRVCPLAAEHKMDYAYHRARQRGTKKQLSPVTVCAKVRNASDIGAEQNHLWPVVRILRRSLSFLA